MTCRAEVADAEDLSSFADGTFDVVTCSAGLMLVPDHNKCVSSGRCTVHTYTCDCRLACS